MNAGEEKLKHRHRWLFLLVSLIFVVIYLRLGYLQVAEGAKYKEAAEQNSMRFLTIRAPRGRFFDRTGEELVTNRPAYVVSYMPFGKDKGQQKRVLDKLRLIIGMTKEEMDAAVKEYAKDGKPYEPITIKTDVDMDTVTRLEENKAELPGVVVDIQPIRYYKGGTLAAHLFGYVGQIDKEELAKLRNKGYKANSIVGKTGLEKLYDLELRGTDGGRIVEVNARGIPVSSKQPAAIKKPEPGDDLYLTIDAAMQRAAEKSLLDAVEQAQRTDPTAKAGAVVALDVKTGAVLAMASYPNFDPNEFAKGITKNEWKALSTNPGKVFNNRAISATYPPGSTFKPITGIAALETGKVHPDTKFNDPGVYYLGSHAFRDDEPAGHGVVTFLQAIKYSINVVFYTLGHSVGIEKMSYYAHQFGLGELTGFELPGESKGRMPDPAWKKQYFKNDKAQQVWYPGETVITAIGQGNNLYTPLQIANMYSAIANGGYLYVPYVVDKVVKPDGTILERHKPVIKRKVNVSPENLAIIRQGLRMVTEPGGTAYNAFKDFPIPVAGKTGTAQNSHGNDHAWFAGYAPANNPQIAIAVIVEQAGHGGTAAAPVAKAVFKAAFRDVINAQITDDTLMNQSIEAR